MTLISLAITLAMSLSHGAVVTPHITGITPATLTPGPSPQLLTVIGTGFMRGLTLTVSNPAGATEVFKDVDVQAQEEASFRVAVTMPIAGVYLFVVTNTDGGVSQPFRLTLRGATPAGPASSASAPVITAVVPSKVSKQTEPQQLRIEGSRFAQGLIVTIDDPTGSSRQYSGNALGNVTPSSFSVSAIILIEGEYTVSVTNPDGQTSNAVGLSVRGETYFFTRVSSNVPTAIGALFHSPLNVSPLI